MTGARPDARLERERLGDRSQRLSGRALELPRVGASRVGYPEGEPPAGPASCWPELGPLDVRRSADPCDPRPDHVAQRASPRAEGPRLRVELEQHQPLARAAQQPDQQQDADEDRRDAAQQREPGERPGRGELIEQPTDAAAHAPKADQAVRARRAEAHEPVEAVQREAQAHQGEREEPENADQPHQRAQHDHDAPSARSTKAMLTLSSAPLAPPLAADAWTAALISSASGRSGTASQINRSDST